MRKLIYPQEDFTVKEEPIQDGCWIKVVAPTSDDLDYLVDEVGVPESFITDTADTDERPRIEFEDGWQLTIIRVPIPTPERGIPFNTVPVGIIFSPDQKTTATICYHSTEVLPDFIEHNRRKRVEIDSQVDFVLRLILCSSVWFLKYIKRVSFMIMEAEEALEKSIRNEEIMQMMNLQKCLVYFNTAIRGNESVISKLRAMRYDDYDAELAEDVAIELHQAYNMVNVYSDILIGTMDAFASIISNNVNTIMRRMTSISIVLMVPTLVASLYGMNVKLFMADNPMAFVFILLICFVLAALAFLYFKRIKWF